MSDDSLRWLMQWYVGQCDNDWEHTYGVEIGTLDNPGWSLKVDLRETALEGRSFARATRTESRSIGRKVAGLVSPLRLKRGSAAAYSGSPPQNSKAL
jgi:hypothetical protein